MKALIHIPQGKFGMIATSSIKEGIIGLCTDNFSTCNIIIFVGKNRASLVHFDKNLFHKDEYLDLCNQATWVKPEKIIIFYKKNQGELILSALNSDTTLFPNDKTEKKELTDDAYGVILQAHDNQGFSFETFIYENIPTNIYYHPFVRKYVAIRNIEQVIGQISRSNPYRAPLIFSAGNWMPPSENEFKINTQDSRTKIEIELFRQDQDFFKIKEILDKIAKKSLHLKDSSFIVQCIEDYIRDFDSNSSEQIFKKNMFAFLASLVKKNPLSEKEKKCLENIIDGCPNNGYQYIKDFLQSDFHLQNDEVKEVEFYYKLFNEHYQRRCSYSTIENTVRLKLESISNQQKSIKDYLSQNKYEEALQLALELMRESRLYCLINSEISLELKLNYAKAVAGTDRYKSSIGFFNDVISIRRKYFPSQDISEVERLLESVSLKAGQQ